MRDHDDDPDNDDAHDPDNARAHDRDNAHAHDRDNAHAHDSDNAHAHDSDNAHAHDSDNAHAHPPPHDHDPAPARVLPHDPVHDHERLAGGRVRDAALRPWLEVTALEREAVAAVSLDGVLVFAGAEPAADVVVVPTHGGFEEHRVLLSAEASPWARYRLTGSRHVSKVVVRHGRVEALGEDGRVLFHTRPAIAVDAAGVRRTVELSLSLAPSAGTKGAERAEDTTGGERAWELETYVETEGLTYPIVIDPSWSHGP